jgi:outer membrane protein
MIRRFISFFGLFILLEGQSHGQQPWTLQQCIDQALQHNIQIRQSSLNNDLNKIQVTQNTASMFPGINGSATQNYYYGRSIDPYTNTFTTSQVRSNSFSLSGSIPLFEGFQIQNSLKESKLNYLASQNDLKKIQNDISLNVVSAYLQILYSEELMKNAEERVNSSTLQRDRLKRMYELGSVSKGNYLDLESQLAADEVSMVQARSQYDQSVLTLTQLLELDSTAGFSILRPEIILPVIDSTQMLVDVVYASALNTQPEIKGSDYKVLSSEKALSAAKGGLYPRLYLGGSLSTNYSTSSKNVTYVELPPTTTITGYTSSGDTVYSVIPNTRATISDTPFRDQIDNNLGKSIGFTLQVPIFNAWSSRSNIARARINLEQTRLNNELTKKNLYKSVQQAVADAIAAQRKFEAGKRSAAAMQESFNYNDKRLEVGMINTYDYLLAKNNLADAKTSLLQAKYDYIFRLKIIDFYLGKPLTF